jgi:hypothetical protein
MLLRSLMAVLLMATAPLRATEVSTPPARIEAAGASIDISRAVASLTRQSVRGTSHGHTADYAGYDLREVLGAAGALPFEPLRGKQLARVVRVKARDGYEVVFALADLDPSLGNTRVLLVDREDGQQLPTEDGPWRLVVPAESRPARWIRQISVVAVSE